MTSKTLNLEMIIQDRYRLSSELGQGGMGTVYLADDLLLERQVAVKILSKTDPSEELRKLLLSEARAAAKLNHPNVVLVYDAGEVDGVPFIVLEYIRGKTLRDAGQLPMDELISISVDICRGLSHAHENGIIHRDLKPENIMITEQAQVKLMDFGLAHLSGHTRLTTSSVLAGTVNYLAPELITGRKATERSDLYALGVILYELAADQPPFQADNLAVLLSNHLHAPVTPPSAHNPAIPLELDTLIRRLLEKDPADRPASAGGVMDVLSTITEQSIPAMGAIVESPVSYLLERIASGRLVGRDEEIAQASSLWTRALAGQAMLLLVSGEPGIGKTRLAQSIVAQASIGRAVVLQGGCYEFEATTPYLPFSEALQDWVRDQDADFLRDVLRETAAELSRLAPEIEWQLGSLPPNPQLSADQQRLRLFDNVAQFLERIASDRGLLLFIDDLHWADKGSLSLLTYLIRRLRQSRMLVIAAYREVELDRKHPLAEALVDWNRQRVAVRIPLSRFSINKTSKMLATLIGEVSVSEDFAQVIHRETDGNPFFIEEVVKALVEQGQIYWAGDHWERHELDQLAIPQSVKEAIGRRLNGLSQPSVEMLNTAAVIGKDFNFTLLQSVTSSSEDDLLLLLEEASSAQLIKQQGAESFVFTHDKIREVLYEEILSIRRRRLHLKIGESIELLYQDQPVKHVEDLAYHYIAAGSLERGMAFALQAAAKARQLFAGEEALVYLQQALECAVSLHDRYSQGEILEGIGDIYREIGPFETAVDYYEQASALSVDRRIPLSIKIGLVFNTTNDERGIPILEEVLQKLDPDEDPVQTARALSALGRFYHYRSQYSAAIDLYDRARKLAEPTSDPQSLSFIYSYLAGAYQHKAEFPQSMHWAEQAIGIGEKSDYLYAVASGYEFIAENNLIMGHWDQALEAAKKDLQAAEKIGSSARRAWANWATGHALFGQGLLNESVDLLLQTVDYASIIGENRLILLCHTTLAMAFADLGDRRAFDYAEKAVEGASRMVEMFQLGNALQATAYTYLQFDRLQEALDSTIACHDLLGETEQRTLSLYRLPYHAEILLRRGEFDEVKALLDQCLQLAEEVGAVHHLAAAQRVSSLLYMELGDLRQAMSAVGVAIELLSEIGSKVELGRSFKAKALIQMANGNSSEAALSAAQALDLFSQCAAAQEVDKINKLLEKLESTAA